jgi:hypothetical protein
MKTKTIYRLLEVSQSKAVNTPVMGTLVKEGQTLPNSVTEDIDEVVHVPGYSKTQLRRINNRLRNKERQEEKWTRKQLGVIAKW